jgi:RNA polymerase sigma factor (sigma-70 family)
VNLEMTDPRALAEFSATRSPQAFAVLVTNHIDLVYSTARRITGDAHLADDVTQAVFIVLMRRARSIDPRFLTGWLVNTARLASRDVLRSRKRRRRHEQIAAIMRSEISSNAEVPEESALASLIDEALGRLSEADRSSIALRFLQGKSFRQVGESLGISGEAARKRVDRAIGRLRSLLTMPGPSMNPERLGLSLMAFQAASAPPDLLNRVVALPAAPAAGSAVAIANGVGWTMTLTKTKMAAATLAILVAAIGIPVTGIVLLQHFREPLPQPAMVQATPQPLQRLPGDPSYDAAAKESINNMKLLGLALAMYETEHQGKWPNSLSDVKKYMAGDYEKVMQNPVTGDAEGYIYKKPPDGISKLPAAATAPVLFEAKAGAVDPDGALLYADWHVGTAR